MIDTFEVVITPFQRKRKVRVCLPNGYETSGKTYPVLYMHDGQNLYRDEDASFGTSWGVKDYIEESGLELIVVGIDCADGTDRLDEYGPWENAGIADKLNLDKNAYGGGGEKYIDYIVHELKPLIDQKYRTQRNDTLMAGSSMGGLISTYAACAYPLIFTRVASVSSAYWFNQQEIEELIRDSDLSSVKKFYMDVGTKEDSGNVNNQMYIDSSDRVYEIMKDKVSDCRYDVVEGGIHNEADWRKRLPEILGYMFL
ncbi:alpha/beta hydrolase [Fictibacillus sp. KIGAM418]|uniref:Alpha/beta hydrolase n=1 Tax=Fictibacillus marinisediminis TaxID=2878389 RepID=A0A9X1XEU0_9BACL|nr:alpha/beta hydrolase-fold protein [Fictibacillus marinisediminis]MCK6258826.1 alpha/beta hydrolase [Fictibacillus marinisediminis]